MISRNITQVFTWKSEPVRVKRGCKFWPWRPCLRAIFLQEKGTSYRSAHMTVKRSSLVVPTYHNEKFGKSRISEGEIPKLLRQDNKTKIVFWIGTWQRNRRSSCWRFPDHWFLDCRLALLSLPSIISWCFDVFTTFVRSRLCSHQETSLGWIVSLNFGLYSFELN